MNSIRLTARFSAFAYFLVLLCCASPTIAEDALSVSGVLNLRGVEELQQNSVKEEPGMSGLIKLDGNNASWKVHSWLEGGRDGAVRKPVQDHSLFKNYDEVYQSNPDYLEFKELYLCYASPRFDLRAGIQRFAWGRLDEYPPNDLLNPWDYSQFLRKPLEDRKIGVPSLSASVNTGDWTYDAVWIPVFVPYRLPMPYERWSGNSSASPLSQISNAEVLPAEPDLPDHGIKNSTIGFRARKSGDIEWAVNLFNGYDPRPVFMTTALAINPQPDVVLIDPGYVPDFHRISVIGLDAAVIQGEWSLRLEAAYTFGRYFNTKRELWGYPSSLAPGVYALNSSELRSDTLDYGIGADYRLFEDGTLIMQAQQTIIMSRQQTLYERKVETILWMNVKAGWLNRKVETNASVAYNPEHGAFMEKVGAWYMFTDAWKAGITAINLTGPSQSLFGRYSRNDQVEAELVYSW